MCGGSRAEGEALSMDFCCSSIFCPDFSVIQFGQLTGNIMVRDKNKFRALQEPKKPLLFTADFLPIEKLIVKPKQLNSKYPEPLV